MYIAAAALLAACGSDSPPRTALDDLVDDYEDGVISRDEFRDAIAAYEDNALPLQLVDDFAETTLLKPRGAPYTIGADLSVSRGAILVIQGGVEIVLGPDVNLNVNGRIYAVGAQDNTVLIRAEAPGRYGQIGINGGPNQLVWVELDRGTRSIDVRHSFDTHTLVESARFDAWGDLAIAQVGSSNLHVLRSQFGYQTAEEDVAGETVRTRQSGVIIIEESTFNYRRGYRDVLDLQDCVEGYWPVIIHNRFDGGEDDAVDLDSCSAFVIGNRISNFTPLDLDAMVAGVNGGGVTGDQPRSKPVILNNVIDNCYHGIGFKNGARPIILNNTITNSNIGITLYQSKQTEAQPHGIVINNVLVGNVGWQNGGEPQEIILNGKWWPSYNQVDDVQATIDARYNITATLPTPYPGEGNINDDPLLEVVDGVPVPGAGSPAIDSGLGDLVFEDAPMQDILEYLSTDVVGTPRALPTIDRGAVEVP